MRSNSALARRAFADARARNIWFAAFFALIAYVNVVGYRHTYKTIAERVDFARSFGANKAVRLFYGVPHDLLSVGGYAAWRVGGTLAIAAAAWGVFAAVRALRAEEESGRLDLVLAQPVGRAGVFRAAIAACAAGLVLLWVAAFAGLVVGGLRAGSSAYLALAIATPAFVFTGVGALASQLAGTRRLAIGLGLGALLVAFALRVVADTAPGLGGLRWATPLGWAEELRPFADTQPLVLVLPLALGAGLVAVAARLGARRDVGAGLLGGAETATPDLRLLRSPARLALREERGTLLAWLAGIGFFALITGLLSTSFTAASIPAGTRRQLHKIGSASLTSPSGALGFYFLMFVFAISLFAASQVIAARREEAEQRLEVVLAMPVGRPQWLAGRLLLACGGCTALAALAALLAWVGAASQNAHVSLWRLLEAGVNCLPTSLLFLGLASLAFACLPRATAALSYALVAAAFMWELVGAIAGAPDWLVTLTPFHHVGLVPAQPFRVGPAALMLAIGAVAAAASGFVFRRRDLAAAG
jgi:ABC-2 type transport system permease protein